MGAGTAGMDAVELVEGEAWGEGEKNKNVTADRLGRVVSGFASHLSCVIQGSHTGQTACENVVLCQ